MTTRRKQMDTEKWVKMATGDERIRPVLGLVSYQLGHSVAANGYSMHLAPEKTENAKDEETMYHEDLGRFPSVEDVWNKANSEMVVCFDPNLLIEALMGMTDKEDWDGIYISFGGKCDPIQMWNPRNGRKAQIMPMHGDEEAPKVPKLKEEAELEVA